MPTTKTQAPPVEERFRIDGVDWEFYQTILRGIGERHVFVTYDRGSLEIMSPSRRHGGFGALIARLIEEATIELGIPMDCGGMMTFRREDLERGIEPDECYWIQNEARVRGKDEIDLTVDPPPDLAIEVEISTRLLDREGIYAALGVPELWRFDGEHLRVFKLGKDGTYRLSKRSPSLPMVPVEVFERFVLMRGSRDSNSIVRAFRDWVREHVPGASRD